MAAHVRSGDQVSVPAGAHKGQTGEITRVIPDKDQVLVKGVNLKTRRVRPTQMNPQGTTVTKEAPIHISNVSPLAGGRGTRVRFETKDDGSKVRVAARDGSVLGELRGAKK